jgi:cbb3-type cytochrome oxidase subunit 3
MKKIKWFFIGIMWLTSLSISDAQVNCYASLDTNEIKLGQKLTLKIALTFPKNGNCIKKPEFKADSIWEVKQSQNWTITKDDYQTTLQTIYELNGWETGEFTIPAFDFEVIYQNRPKSTCSTTPMVVNILKPKEIADPVDIKGIVKEPNTWRDYMSFFIAIGFFGFLALVVYFIYKKRKEKRAIPVFQEAKLPPYALAMKRMEELQSKKYLDENLQKDYTTDLTYLWREYIENRYNLPALESTSEELLVLLKKNKLDSKNLDAYKSMLRSSDFIKFANQQTTIEELNSHMEIIANFIETTKPEETIQ